MAGLGSKYLLPIIGSAIVLLCIFNIATFYFTLPPRPILCRDADEFGSCSQAVMKQADYCSAMPPLPNDVIGTTKKFGNGTAFQINVYRKGDLASAQIVKKTRGWAFERTQRLMAMLSDVAKQRDVPHSQVTFVDIGANVGWFTLVMASQGFKVLAFEPMPKNNQLIRRSLCDNPEFSPFIVYYNSGLWDKVTECVVYSDDEDIGRAQLSCATDFQVPKGHKVRGKIFSDRFDEFVSTRRSSGIPHDTSTIGVVKMDVGGAEALVLAGGRDVLLNGNIPYLVIRYAPEKMQQQGSDPKRFIRTLLEAGTYDIHMGSVDGPLVSSVSQLFVGEYENPSSTPLDLDLVLVSKLSGRIDDRSSSIRRVISDTLEEYKTVQNPDTQADPLDEGPTEAGMHIAGQRNRNRTAAFDVEKDNGYCTQKDQTSSTIMRVAKSVARGERFYAHVYKGDQEILDIASETIRRTMDGWEYGKLDSMLSLLTKERMMRQASSSELVFVDIGANIGWFSMVMASHGFQVIAFEPMMQNANVFKHTLCDNRELAKSITFYPTGLSNQRSVCEMYSHPRNIGRATMQCESHRRVPDEYMSRGQVTVDRLDAFIALSTSPHNGIPHDTSNVGLVHIDVEGFEAYVLEGGQHVLLNGGIPYIVIRFSPRKMREKGSDPQAFLQRIISAGTYDVFIDDLRNAPIASVPRLLAMVTRSPDATKNLILSGKHIQPLKPNAATSTTKKKTATTAATTATTTAATTTTTTATTTTDVSSERRDEKSGNQPTDQSNKESKSPGGTSTGPCANLPLPPEDARLIMKSHGGKPFHIRVYTESATSFDIVSDHILKRGGWDVRKLKFMAQALIEVARQRNVKRNQVTFVDIGAHIGWFTMVMASYGFKVLAFEPMPKNHQMIRYTLCDNPELAELIVYYNIGLSEKPSKCKMYAFGRNIGDGNLYCGNDTYEVPEGFVFRGDVASDRLDKFIAPKAGPAKASAQIPHDTSRIGLVKIDVEGFEAHVLAGGEDVLLHGGIPVIIMEFSPPMLKNKGSDPRALIQKILDAATYDIYSMEGDQREAWTSADQLIKSLNEDPDLAKDLILASKADSRWVQKLARDIFKVDTDMDPNIYSTQGNANSVVETRVLKKRDRSQMSTLERSAVLTQDQFCSKLPMRPEHMVNIIKSIAGGPKFVISVYNEKRENGSDIVSSDIQIKRNGWDFHKVSFMLSVLHKTAQHRRVPRDQVIFVDIGANIGWFTMVIASHGFKVLAFEPMPQNDLMIRHTLCANPMLSELIVYYNTGLSEKPSKCKMYADPDNIGNGNIYCGNDTHEVPEGFVFRGDVASDRLDKFIALQTDQEASSSVAPHDTSRIGLVKIDVEGFEAHVLAGGEDVLLHGGIPVIIMEFSPPMLKNKGSDPRALIQKILDAGTYDVYVENVYLEPLDSCDQLLKRIEHKAHVVKDLILILKSDTVLPRQRPSGNLKKLKDDIVPTSKEEKREEKREEKEKEEKEKKSNGFRNRPEHVEKRDRSKLSLIERNAVLQQDAFCLNPPKRPEYMLNVIKSIDRGNSFKIYVYMRNKTNYSDLVSFDVRLNRKGWDYNKTTFMLFLLRRTAQARGVSRKEVTFVDIGANIGWFTMVMASHGFKVMAFEPMPQNDLMIRHTLCENPELAESVVYYNTALSEKPSKCKMYALPDNIGNGNIFCTNNLEVPEGFVFRGDVASDRLDKFIAPPGRVSLDIPHDTSDIGLVKIDVEGFEAHVLAGGEDVLLHGGIPYIIMEFNPHMIEGKGSDPRALIQKILDAGTYDIYVDRLEENPLANMEQIFERINEPPELVKDLILVLKTINLKSAKQKY